MARYKHDSYFKTNFYAQFMARRFITKRKVNNRSSKAGDATNQQNHTPHQEVLDELEQLVKDQELELELELEDSKN